jgi:hypothetical protein
MFFFVRSAGWRAEQDRVYTKSSGIGRPISHYLEEGVRLTELGRNARRTKLVPRAPPAVDARLA